MDTTHDIAQLLLQAVKDKQWSLLVVVALIASISAVRAVLGKRIAFLTTDAGGAMLTLAMAVLGGLANVLLAGGALSWGVLLTALTMAVKAAGGYSLVKKLLRPLFKKLPASLAWLDFFFTTPLKSPAAVIEEAKVAGEAAVKEKPPTGVDGVLGVPKDVP